MRQLKPKIAIVGAGNVGSTFAFSLMISGLAREIVLIDKNESLAKGECMDLNHGLSFAQPTKIYAAGFESCKDADIVVITAGANQKPGQSRTDLVKANVAIFKELIPDITKYATNAILLVVTNPVDILTYVTLKISGFPSNRIIGSGTVLDTARLKYMLSEYYKVDASNIHAYIIGEHGDTELPVWSNATIGGMDIETFCSVCARKSNSKNELEEIFDNVKNAAYQIIQAKGATNYSIALSLVKISQAIVRNENSILPVSTLITDFYGISDVCISIPAIVNITGVEQYLKLNLSDQEQKLFVKSAKALKDIIKASNF
ncbi:L-lactate dehydrogenase [Williamwhitmania taraxaci]|uniref:L-lactate dehydrogenase n=1 Tax=Williamwhitmania taraxaci TaxID=1640674 RepID=A0A1G6H1S5_9BACT|nr:L-lactate dehydrogenase [Williamwhitmania taraxaci]SDB88103.1 L-lactate dehydrogenase [Williamwhitmania taraxaci]